MCVRISSVPRYFVTDCRLKAMDHMLCQGISLWLLLNFDDAVLRHHLAENVRFLKLEC